MKTGKSYTELLALIPAERHDEFEKSARELFAARWTDVRVVEWARMPVNFGHYLTTDEATDLVGWLLVQINAAIRRTNNAARRELREDLNELAKQPVFAELLRVTGAKLRRP